MQGYVTLGGQGAEFVSLDLPDSKEEIEATIVAGAVRDADGDEPFVVGLSEPPVQRPEDGHHFMLRTVATASQGPYSPRPCTS